MVGGWKETAGWSLIGVAFATWIAGFMEFDMGLVAGTCVVAGLAAFAGIWFPRVAGAVLAAMCVIWVLAFPGAGISVLSTVAAGLFAVGFLAVALQDKFPDRRFVVAGVGLAFLANLYYTYDNAIVAWFGGFAYGNLLFIAGTALLGWALMETGPEAAATPPAPQKKPARKATKARARA